MRCALFILDRLTLGGVEQVQLRRSMFNLSTARILPTYRFVHKHVLLDGTPYPRLSWFSFCRKRLAINLLNLLFHLTKNVL